MASWPSRSSKAERFLDLTTAGRLKDPCQASKSRSRDYQGAAGDLKYTHGKYAALMGGLGVLGGQNRPKSGMAVNSWKQSEAEEKLTSPEAWGRKSKRIKFLRVERNAWSSLLELKICFFLESLPRKSPCQAPAAIWALSMVSVLRRQKPRSVSFLAFRLLRRELEC